MSDRVRRYLQSRIEGLTEDSRQFLELSPENVNDFDTWSALKLILHSTTVNMYTTVMRDNGYYEDLYYIDALAGSGVSLYQDERCFLGSPLLAAKMANTEFKKMYFVEQNEDFATALEERLEYAFTLPAYTEPEEWEVKDGEDANEAIPDIVSEIWDNFDESRGTNYLTFIDNQGMDVMWDAITELTPTPHGDLLINLPIAQAIGRNAEHNPETVSEFYGLDITDQDLSESDMRDRLQRLYLDRLSGRERSVQVSTKVDANVGSYYYDIIYATRNIPGGNGYEETVRYVRDFIEQVHAGDVSVILDILEGDQSTLNTFLPDDAEGIEEELPEEDDPQTDISDWV